MSVLNRKVFSLAGLFIGSLAVFLATMYVSDILSPDYQFIPLKRIFWGFTYTVFFSITTIQFVRGELLTVRLILTNLAISVLIPYLWFRLLSVSGLFIQL
ncbi:hypothetical protein [Dyadobacter diqingensis]|uniref:hypothetical protein n=1 Tax=Dyadobacter diqingensis TaxID=2938121 RepID=UPI0020C2F0DC|nr:hypothetical protein [Dyadobacter diqingensis]